MRKGFKTPEWAATTNIYEVNIRQYTPEGTFRAFVPHLPRLKDMGVKTLWFMPVTPIATERMKGSMGSYYACCDYTDINPEFGTMDDFRGLVQLAHDMGFKVIMDWVANHTGWGHRWTVEHPDFYLKDPLTGNFQVASGMDDIIELDYNNPDLVDAMINAMKFWVDECNIDGFRCDLAAWVELHFWEKARPAVDALKPLFWLGEFDELENPEYGTVFDASYTWVWMHQAEDFYKQRLPVHILDTLLQRYSALGDGTMRAWFTSNHDENSWNGTEYEKYGSMAPALAVFSCTWNGVPLIYNGQEIPMKTKRLEFFDKDIIPWPNEFELHDFFRTLFELHSTHPALRGGDPAVTTYRIYTNKDNAFVYLRRNADREVLVLINLSHEPVLEFGIPPGEVKGVFINAFSGELMDLDKQQEFRLTAWDYLVLVR